MDRKSAYLKVHTRDGTLFVLSNWSVDEETRILHGEGRRLTPNRAMVVAAAAPIPTPGGETSASDAAPPAPTLFAVPLDSVAVLETNTVRLSPAIIPMVIVAGVSAMVTIACLAEPKNCFGSCPTFYVTDGTQERLQAEGFSASIAPSLEATDVDALYRARPTGRVVEVRMTNEALETHVVRQVDLLAVPRGSAETRVVRTIDGEFRPAVVASRVRAATGSDGDCTRALADFDGDEYHTLTDGIDLATRDTVLLEYDTVAEGPLGLRLATRQGLVSTFLFYQTLSWLGSQTGYWMAELERGSPLIRERLNAMGSVLGGLTVSVQQLDGRWFDAGTIDEVGPIAIDVHVVPLAVLTSALAQPVRIRLVSARAAWRIDEAAIVQLGAPVDPVRLQPRAVYRGANADPASHAALLDPEQTLVSMPGDRWTLEYELPAEAADTNAPAPAVPAAGYELFLESRGYYIEWMREEWLAEEDPARALQFFLSPRHALRDLAPEYKRGEARLEELFWGSRYEKR